MGPAGRTCGWLLATAAVFAIASCGDGDGTPASPAFDRTAIERTMHTYFDALEHADGERACAQLTQAVQARARTETGAATCPEALEAVARYVPDAAKVFAATDAASLPPVAIGKRDSILRGSRRFRVERRLIAPSAAAFSAALDRRRFRDMAFKHRLADASYWFYDRARHRTAFESAVEPGTASDFAGLKGHKYALLVTFRRDGTAVPTPVWFALLDDRHLVVSSEERTAKVRRIRRDPRARVIPCDPRGKPLGPGVEGTARILEDAQDCERAEAALDRHYGATRRIYEKVMAPKEGMVYLEIARAVPLTDRPPD